MCLLFCVAQGDRNFSRTFPCRYCYQTGEDEQCCTPSDSCNVSLNNIDSYLYAVCVTPHDLQVRGTPRTMYRSECVVNGNVFCLRK